MTRRTLVPLAAVACLLTAPAAQAAFPGPNGKIAFENTSQGVALINPDGSAFAGLATAGASREDDPAYSPDGRFVAYAQGRDVWIAAVDRRSAPRQVTTGGNNDQSPAFSPDGTRIVFLRNDSAADLHVVGVDGRGLRNLTNDPAGTETHPQWSPDGRQIAFTRTGCAPDDDSGQCVWVMNADGTGKTLLTPEDVPAECPGIAPGNTHRRHSAEPSWSPDGSMIAFSGHYDVCKNDPAVNNGDIWVMNRDGSGKRNLTSADMTLDRQPSWSPDGSRIAFVRDPADRSDAELFSIPVGGGAASQITNNSDTDEDPDWGRTPQALCSNLITGSPARNTLNGTPGSDRIRGLGGNDVINGLQGDDCLDGGAGDDALSGSEGNDVLLGGAGRDKLAGGLGNDTLTGGAGNDKLDGGQGTNRFSGGAGNDNINSANGRKETVNCGAGRDTLRADRSDRARGCERVRRVR